VRFLNRAAQKHAKARNKHPDICIFTGDLAYHGRADEFAIGERWLKELLEPWKNTKLFFVPGNHDITRPDSRKSAGKKLIGLLRGAVTDASQFRRVRDYISSGQHLKAFVDWHQSAKTDNRLPLISDWGLTRFASYAPLRLDLMKISIIGLNTAVLSCGNDDRGRLVADIDTYDQLFLNIDPQSELFIAASHHPICLNDCSETNRDLLWLAEWNNSEIRERVLRAIGPHLYLHGHVHVAEGFSTSIFNGQHIASLGAGAAYDTDKYPMKFAFYEIDLGNKEIRPTGYFYHRLSGEW